MMRKICWPSSMNKPDTKLATAAVKNWLLFDCLMNFNQFYRSGAEFQFDFRFPFGGSRNKWKWLFSASYKVDDDDDNLKHNFSFSSLEIFFATLTLNCKHRDKLQHHHPSTKKNSISLRKCWNFKFSITEKEKRQTNEIMRCKHNSNYDILS